MRIAKHLPIFALLTLLSLSSCSISFDTSTSDVNTSLDQSHMNSNDPQSNELSIDNSVASVSVDNTIYVTNITLNKEQHNMYLGTTYQLIATVTPEDATNREVIWSSSNPSVATVENGLITPHTVGTTTISAKSMDDKFKASCLVTVENPSGIADYTIMIYMCGSDLESDRQQGGLASSNIKEILSLNNKPSNVNVIIQTGGATRWYTSGISANNIHRFEVTNSKITEVDRLANASMGNPATFQSFIEWGLTDYPALQTGVILWNHGGAMEGCCFDELYNNDSLLNSEVSTALSNAFKNVNREEKLAWIGYDCCLMQVCDVADFNSDYFNYMIASQETEPGEGWDYDAWLDDLYANSKIQPSELLQVITDTYVAKCADVYRQYGYRNFNDATMSVLDLSKMEQFRLAFESIALDLSAIIRSQSAWNTFKNLLNRCQQFGDISETNYPEYAYDVFDLGDFINEMKSSSSYSLLNIQDLEDAFDELLIYNKYGISSYDASGLSIFAAITRYTNKMYYSTKETRFTNWQALNYQYGSWNTSIYY